MEPTSLSQDGLVISGAVSAWYHYYGATWDDRASSILCDAAIAIFDGGCRSVDGIAAALIGSYVGILGTRVNAPTSEAVH